MRKERNLYGLRNHKKHCYCGLLFLLLFFMTSCKTNQFLIDSNEVEYVHFWFVGDIDTNHALENCEDVVFMQESHDTIMRDRRIIERFVSVINRSKPINPKSNYDLRVSSLVRLKPINGENRPDIKVCIGNYGRRVLLNDVLMKGDHEELQKFIQEELYDALTPYQWLPEVIKDYLKDHPEERNNYLPDE